MQVELNKSQLNQLKPICNRASIEDKNGTPGMVIAQIFDDGSCMEVGFVQHKEAVKIQEVMGVYYPGTNKAKPEATPCK